VEVQVFGVRKSADTRAALRFFAQRRIKTHFVDLNERAASLGELRRFAQKFGVQALIDRDAKRFAELGLKSALLSEDRWLEKLTLEPLLLRMPLVRQQQQLTVGAAEETWRAWLAAAQASPSFPDRHANGATHDHQIRKCRSAAQTVRPAPRAGAAQSTGLVPRGIPPSHGAGRARGASGEAQCVLPDGDHLLGYGRHAGPARCHR